MSGPAGILRGKSKRHLLVVGRNEEWEPFIDEEFNELDRPARGGQWVGVRRKREEPQCSGSK